MWTGICTSQQGSFNARLSVSALSKLLGGGSISSNLNICARVLAEHLEQLERQRAKVLGISGLIEHLAQLMPLDLQKSGK